MTDSIRGRADRRVLTADDLVHMRVPQEFWRVRLDSVQEGARARVASYLTKLDTAFAEGAGLLLMGHPGVGKTAIAVLVAKEAFCRHRSAFFTTFWELRDGIRGEEMFNDSESLLGRCKTVDLLVLDDLRAEDADAKFWLDARAIEEIIRHRRGRRLPTVVTTRLSGQELSQSLKGLGSAVKGAMLPLEVKGVDLREKRNEELAAVLLETKPAGKSKGKA